MRITKKLTHRRAATFLAALGMLVMSSGLALMVAAPAQAANKVGICHATSSDSNPYVFISVDDDSVKFRGHLQHRSEPNKRWKTDGSFNGVNHVADQPKPDLIGSFTDDQGVFHLMDGDVTEATCEAQGPPPEVLTAVADVEFQDPDCDNGNVADLDLTEENASHVTEGTVAPGEYVKITFAADEDAAFDEGAQTVFEHTFGETEICEVVLPPTPVIPADPTFVDPDCETDPAVVLPEASPVVEDVNRSAELIETKDVDGVHYEVAGDLVPGGTVDVDATALDGYEIADGATTHWSHTFSTVGSCEVAPPGGGTATPTPTETETVATPTVVHAGLAGAGDLRAEQGLALLVAGMAMLVGAGALGLRRGTVTV